MSWVITFQSAHHQPESSNSTCRLARPHVTPQHEGEKGWTASVSSFFFTNSPPRGRLHAASGLRRFFASALLQPSWQRAAQHPDESQERGGGPRGRSSPQLEIPPAARETSFFFDNQFSPSFKLRGANTLLRHTHTRPGTAPRLRTQVARNQTAAYHRTVWRGGREGVV